MRRELDPNNLLRASAGVSQHGIGSASHVEPPTRGSDAYRRHRSGRRRRRKRTQERRCRSGFARITDRRSTGATLSLILTSGTHFNPGLFSAATHPDRAPTILPTDEQPLVSARRVNRPTSDIWTNAACSTRVLAKPLKSWQFPAFRHERQDLGRSVH